VLQDKALTPVQRQQLVRDIAYEGMDFEVLSRLTLGRNWRPLTDAQRTDFVQEYKKHLAGTYGHTTDSYTNETINVTSDQKESNGDVTVLTQIMGDKDGKRQEVAKVNYRMRQNQGQWKVIDVMIDGVSLMANFRSQFQEVIDNGGFDKLMKLLREKNAAQDAK
jgi:phospholipid transport system substrate-binding protein